MNETQRELLIAGAGSLGVALDDASVTRFSLYLSLLQRWGRKINLSTRLETTEVILYHFLDSLAGAPILAASPAARVVDLGAGAGLPSMPLKFAVPDLRMLLVESVRKKVAFCQEVIRATGMDEIEALWGRAEDLGVQTEHHQVFDWAVSRALGSSAAVARLALPFLAAGGRVLLYKGEPDAGELKDLDAFCTENKAAWEMSQVSVPHLKAARRLIIVRFP